MNAQTHHQFNQLPIELRRYLVAYLDQSNLIEALRYDLRELLARNEALRKQNKRLVLERINNHAHIQNLEHILANNLETEANTIQRELDFENLSDTDDEYSDAEEVDV